MPKPTIADLNRMDRDAFVAVCGGFFEHSPWVAEMAWSKRPFNCPNCLTNAMLGALRGADDERKLALIRAHPDLVGRLAREGRLTRESSAEQRAAGLAELTDDEIALFDRYNSQYREKFGFPFVICARENRKEAILAAMPLRLRNTPEQEITAALTEIEKIAKLRLKDAIAEG
jgi:OHCU decarboxylase